MPRGNMAINFLIQLTAIILFAIFVMILTAMITVWLCPELDVHPYEGLK